jgi:hypothetical protein
LVAFVGSFLVALVGMGAVVAFGQRRPVGAELTWGEAIAAAVYVIALMFWAYGVVPHQFLTWANNELNWTAANQLKGWGDFLVDWPYVSTIKFSHETLSHTIVAGIYGFFLTAHVAMWAIWNDRAKKADAKAKAELEPSTYGRPLVKQG